MFHIQVIGGKFKGLKLESDKNEKLRPTKDRVKESIFDILQFQIINKNFVDAFGGTGQIGIEALSRGANQVTILESNQANVNLINKNIKKIKKRESISVIHTDVRDFLKNYTETIDIIFLDPPYKQLDLLYETAYLAEKKMASDGIIITETLSEHSVKDKLRNFSLKKKYKYGIISLNLYKIINFTLGCDQNWK